jgi:IS5 family transposase
MKQTTFASLAFDRKKKQTRREKFLAEMEQAVPWPELLAVIEPHYPKAGRRGRQPYPLATMLRLYFLQQWYALSDPGLEDALYEIESMRRFAGLELADDALPDETTILNFRRLLERHELTAKLMNAINDVLEARGLLLKGGTMVDATIIHAAPSTKNKAKTRDPEMHQTKKGNQWFFGMKVHVGADVHTGVAHTVSVTPAHAADISQLPNLLREDDRLVIGDAAHVQRHLQARCAAGRGRVGHSPESPSETALGGCAETPQSANVVDPQPSRAPVSGDEAAVRLHQDALPGPGQDRRPGVYPHWVD